MTGFQLPPKRTMSSAFAGRGRTDVVKIECLEIRDDELLRLTFESVNSPLRQGVWLRTDRGLHIANQLCLSADLWQDTSPREVMIHCHTTDGFLHLYNIWEDSGRRESQMWTTGMLVEELPTGRRYRCNDFGFDTEFDKLVFRLERVG